MLGTEATNAEQKSTLCDGELVYAEIKRDTHREKERDGHKTNTLYSQ